MEISKLLDQINLSAINDRRSNDPSNRPTVDIGRARWLVKGPKILTDFSPRIKKTNPLNDSMNTIRQKESAWKSRYSHSR